MKIGTLHIIGCLAFATLGGARLGLTAPSPNKQAAAKTDERTLGMCLKRFKTACGRYPTTEEGLNALVSSPSGLESVWQGPYLTGNKVPLDPWGNPYSYSADKRHFKIVSFGKDGILGGRRENADVSLKG